MKLNTVKSILMNNDFKSSDRINRLHQIIYDLCQKWDCKLIEFNGEANHVHLLFQDYPLLLLLVVVLLFLFLRNILKVKIPPIRVIVKTGGIEPPVFTRLS